MPITQRNTLAPNNLVYTTGNYINPLWIISLAPAKVGSGIPQWNASQLQGRNISPVYPNSGDVLQWNGTSWYPTGVVGSGGGVVGVSTGVTSFNSRTGVVVLTSGDVSTALGYTPYNGYTNPSGFLSSGYYTANSGIIQTGSNFRMGGTGTLDELDFSGPVKIHSVGSDIIIGQNAASDNGYSNSNSISIGTNAGSNSTYLANIFIGESAGRNNSYGGNNIAIGEYAGYNIQGSQNLYIGLGAGTSAIASHAIELRSVDGSPTRISSDYDIHIQDVIGGNISTRRLSFGDITMTPDANVQVISSESTTTPFIVKGAVFQTANLLEIQQSDSSRLVTIDNLGDIQTSGNFTSATTTLDGTANGNLPDTSVHIIDSNLYTNGDTIKYIVKAKKGSAIQSSEILLIGDGTDSYLTQYGVVYSSGLLCSFSTSYSDGYINLSAQAVYSDVNYKIFKTIIN